MDNVVIKTVKLAQSQLECRRIQKNDRPFAIFEFVQIANSGGQYSKLGGQIGKIIGYDPQDLDAIILFDSRPAGYDPAIVIPAVLLRKV